MRATGILLVSGIFSKKQENMFFVVFLKYFLTFLLNKEESATPSDLFLFERLSEEDKKLRTWRRALFVTFLNR